MDALIANALKSPKWTKMFKEMGEEYKKELADMKAEMAEEPKRVLKSKPKRVLKSKPRLAILEIIYESNNDEVHSSDFYLVRSDWKLRDLRFNNSYVVYKGKFVECPSICPRENYEDQLGPEEFAKLVISETPTEMRFADDDWESMFEGHTIDDIVITDEDAPESDEE